MKYSEIDVKVGDMVYVLPNMNGHGGGKFPVSRIGRKLVAIQQYGRERTFDKVTRQERSEGAGGFCLMLTLDEHREYVRRLDVIMRVRTLTSNHWWTDNLSVSTLEQVANLIEAETGKS